MGFYVPWAINHSEHPARLARRMLQQQVGSGSGVDRPGDLKVQALSTPGNGFRVAAGGGIAQSRDTSASSRESYGPINDAEIVITGVPGTGSGQTRRDLVILEITDPEMESVTYPAPADPEYMGGWQVGDTFCRITVIPGVAAGVKSLDQITTGPFANVTGITLAAINWLQNTTTIGAGAAPSTGLAAIEDLRVVQSPLSIRQQDLVSFGGTVALPGSSEVVWPAASQQVRIPERANELTVMARILGMLVTVNSVGVEFRLRLGNTGSFIYSDAAGLTTDTASGGTERVDKVVPMRVQIPAAMRGTTQPLVIMAKKTTGTGTLSVTNRTVVEFDSTLAETTV